MSETTSRYRSALSILQIQDHAQTVRMTRMALDDVPLPKRIHHISSGEGALALLDEGVLSGRPPRFDIVLLDLQLPGLSGPDTLAAIRTRPHWTDLTILLMAGVEHTGRYVRSLSAYTVIRNPSDAASISHMSACFLESFTAIMKNMKRFQQHET